MAEKKRRIEGWLRFVSNRFLPFFWADFSPRFRTTMLAILAAMLVLAAQLYFGVIGSSGIQGRELAIFGPYAVLLAMFAIYHAVRAPWLISNDHLESIKSHENAKVVLQQELEDQKRIPPTIDIAIRELYRKPVDSGHGGNAKDGYPWDIFLAVRIELKNPLSVSILQYKMELSLHGNQIPLQAIDDLDKRGLDIWKPSGELAHAELIPLSMQLKSGEPREGWLHFLSPQATYKVLDECTVRLIADTGHGSGFRECAPGPTIWNPQNKQFPLKT